MRLVTMLLKSSGKVTYVKPHTKGKLRDTLAVGREYDLDVKCKEK